MFLDVAKYRGLPWKNLPEEGKYNGLNPMVIDKRNFIFSKQSMYSDCLV